MAKFFQASQQGAPSLYGQNGSLISVLDACLVNGYGQVNVSSLTRSGSAIFIITDQAHKLKSGDSIILAGATQPEYNGEFVVTVTGPTSLTSVMAGTPVTPATGTITCKRAPAGFDKVFSGTNKAVYRSKDTSGLRHYIQVIDDGTTTGGAKEAKIRGYVSMSDVDTGTDPFPTVAQSSVGLLAYKSSTIDSTARPWSIVSDGKSFYFKAAMDVSPVSMLENSGYIWWFAFGDLIPSRPGSLYHSFLTGSSAQNLQTTSGNQNGLFYPTNQTLSGSSSGCYMPRDWNQSIGAVACCPVGHGWNQSCLGSLQIMAYPHAEDNGFWMTEVLMTQRGVIRGRFPGVYEPLHGKALNNYDVIDNVTGYAGRTFMGLYGVHGTTTGMLMFDLTGPWT